MSHRLERVSELIRSEVSALLLRGIRDSRVKGLVTVTDVEVSGDLRQSKVFVSVMGTPAERKRTLEGLQSARAYVRREVARRIKLRVSPEIDFVLDESMERGARVLGLMRELGLGEEEVKEAAEEPGPDDESSPPEGAH
jgi:ribosome-binding factor A